MDDLVAFLRARLDEDEAVARAATDGPWSPWEGRELRGLGDLIHPVRTPGQMAGSRATIVTASWLDAEHIARHNPARVLAEVAAKRRIVEDYAAAMADRQAIRAEIRKILHTDPDAFGKLSRQENALIDKAEGLAPIIRIMATVFAAHPDYRPEWAPAA
jgi:hypothetical protein